MENSGYELIDELPVGVAVAKGGHEFHMMYVNREFLRREGYTREELLNSGKSYVDYICEEDVGAFEDAVTNCREKKSSEVLELRVRAKDGRMCWEMVQIRLHRYQDAVPYYIVTSWDIEERKRQEEEKRLAAEGEQARRLAEEVRLDPLTRVLNKVAVSEEIERFLEQNGEGMHALFLIDIDNFKRINDTFGHTVGDTVIMDVAHAVQKQFAGTGIVGRAGGDEFLALMKHTTIEQAERMAKALCQKAGKNLIGDDSIVPVTLSVGVSIYGETGENYETLFEMADRAMYQAKNSGKNRYVFANKDGQSVEGYLHKKQVTQGSVRGQEADKDFLNFAFSLLSHARDINGSLNVLIEQIGRRFGLDMVSVFEYFEDRREMALMNYWSDYGPIYEKSILPRTVSEFESAKPGDFVIVSREELLAEGGDFHENWDPGREPIRHLAGVKFEFSGNRVGCMYVGVHQMEEGFSQEEENTFGELGRIVGVFVSLRRRQFEDQREISQLQNEDQLTGLYNLKTFRAYIEEHLKAGELWAKEPKESSFVYGIVNVDVNNLSYVNENFGQHVGDNILKEFGSFLAHEEHVVKACRMYSDFFIVLVRGESEIKIYRQVLAQKEAFEAQQKQKYPSSVMSLSVGICFAGTGEGNFETLLEGANLARKMAKTKSSGVVIYREDMREKRNDELKITGRFYGALQRGEFEVFLQPKFLLKEEEIYGAEALARWRLESGEVLSPARFIPPLEKLGYVVDLDFYILEQLLRAMRRWKESGRKLITVSTNFSRKNFENGGEFVKRLDEMMKRYGIEPRYIEIEVTESVVVENLAGLKTCLRQLEELGFRIAIDDFGTGYSSLSVLLEIPADVIKFDKSFTDQINLQEQREFISRMGQLIKSAKEEVIFEGIEAEEQRRFLMDCGFSYGQGYLFDRPLPLDVFERKYL